MQSRGRDGRRIMGADVSGQPDGRGPHGGPWKPTSPKKPRATKSGTAAIRNSDGAHSHTSGAATRIKLPDRPAPLLPWNVPGTVQRVWCELSRGGQQLFVVGNPSGRNHSTMSMQIAPYFPRTP